MERKDLENRTKAFAVQIITFVTNLPKNKVTDVLDYQLIKSGTSIGANYREARSAESHDDFIHKIGIVEKEASETQYWLELLRESSIGNLDELQSLLQECSELCAIFTATGKTAKSNRNKKQ